MDSEDLQRLSIQQLHSQGDSFQKQTIKEEYEIASIVQEVGDRFQL